MKISDSGLINEGDQLWLSQNARKANGTWYATDTTKDSYLIEFTDSASEQGYISIKRAPAHPSSVVWTEMMKFNYDGTFILHPSLISPPAAPAADQAKVYIGDYLGRLQSFMKTATETVSLMQGAGTNRIWRVDDDSFPANAKRWDLLLKPAAIRGLRYGEIWVEGNATTTTISVTNTWYQVLVFDTDGAENGTTPDHTNDHITINHSGLYHVVCSVSMISTGGTSYQVDVSVHKNNGATRYDNLHFSRQMSGGGSDVGSGSISGLAYFEANDTVELWIRNVTNTNDITIQDCNITIVELQPSRG